MVLWYWAGGILGKVMMITTRTAVESLALENDGTQLIVIALSVERSICDIFFLFLCTINDWGGLCPLE
ncbi:hypothetical protein F511_32542 [Dorcoceras hygrometricum]|uniref:Uncharacterized protein n=1 Tax=Dorcoceras hygrometricum TaxID=472368 RepID=A0A2Z7A0W8_9LAMI|nr:hypothetical protein F511_32542 [Dorcoceras hygrometricum]